MSYGKRRTQRQEGGGAKAPECVIAAGRWVLQQTRFLVSSLTKRGMNSIKKKGQFKLNYKYMHNEFPHGFTLTSCLGQNVGLGEE